MLMLVTVSDGEFSNLDQDFQQLRGEGYQVTPVSYTHLRAHETVLDLVCRLLLEKKTTEIQDTELPGLQCAD